MGYWSAIREGAIGILAPAPMPEPALPMASWNAFWDTKLENADAIFKQVDEALGETDKNKDGFFTKAEIGKS